VRTRGALVQPVLTPAGHAVLEPLARSSCGSPNTLVAVAVRFDGEANPRGFQGDLGPGARFLSTTWTGECNGRGLRHGARTPPATTQAVLKSTREASPVPEIIFATEEGHHARRRLRPPRTKPGARAGDDARRRRPPMTNAVGQGRT